MNYKYENSRRTENEFGKKETLFGNIMERKQKEKETNFVLEFFISENHFYLL